MSLLDYVARTTSQLRLLQSAALRQTCKNRYSAALPDRRRCLLSPLVEPMVRHKQPRELNDSVRKKVTKRKHRWMRIVTFQWKHHRMKINMGLPRSVRSQVQGGTGERAKGRGHKRKKRRRAKMTFTLPASKNYRCPRRSGVLAPASVAKSSDGIFKPTQCPTNPSQMMRYVSGVTPCPPAMCLIASAVLQGWTKNMGAPVIG